MMIKSLSDDNLGHALIVCVFPINDWYYYLLCCGQEVSLWIQK